MRSMNQNVTETPTTPSIGTAGPALEARIRKTIAKRTFCTIATTSPAGRSHSAGVVYEFVDGDLWFHSMRSSRKARNIAANPWVGITIPFRRLPVGPPFTIHFQAGAELVAMDDPRVLALLQAGRLGAISGHGALDEPDGTFVRITPRGNVHSYGPGARVIDLIRDPLHSGAASFPVEAR